MPGYVCSACSNAAAAINASRTMRRRCWRPWSRTYMRRSSPTPSPPRETAVGAGQWLAQKGVRARSYPRSPRSASVDKNHIPRSRQDNVPSAALLGSPTSTTQHADWSFETAFRVIPGSCPARRASYQQNGLMFGNRSIWETGTGAPVTRLPHRPPDPTSSTNPHPTHDLIDGSPIRRRFPRPDDAFGRSWPHLTGALQHTDCRGRFRFAADTRPNGSTRASMAFAGRSRASSGSLQLPNLTLPAAAAVIAGRFSRPISASVTPPPRPRLADLQPAECGAHADRGHQQDHAVRSTLAAMSYGWPLSPSAVAQQNARPRLTTGKY